MNLIELYNEQMQLKGLEQTTLKGVNIAIKKLVDFQQTECGDSNHNINDIVKGVDVMGAFSFRKYLLNNGLAKGTVNKDINNLKSFYKFMEKNSFIKANPFKGLENIKVTEDDNKQQRYAPNKKEALEIIKAFKTKQPMERNFEYTSIRNVALFSILFSTGIRVNNILSVTRDRLIAIEEGYIINYRADETKGDVPVTIYIVGKNKELMDKWLEVRKGGEKNLLFTTCNGGKISSSDINNILKKRTKVLGIEGMVVHGCRAFCANNLMQHGVDKEDIRKMLGWSTDVMMTHYAREEQLRSKYIEYSKLFIG